MAHTTHIGRITGPVHYSGHGGGAAVVPLGPCLVEQVEGRMVIVFWGENADEAAALSFEAVEAAEGNGHLVVLD